MNRPLRSITAALLSVLLGSPLCAAPAEPPSSNNSALDGELFYRLIVGELSTLNGDNSTAFASFLSAARKAKSEPLYERSVQVALAARSPDFALQAAQDWASAFPKSFDANRYLLQILVGVNRTADSLEPLKRTLAASTPQERLRVISALPRIFTQASDKKLAATVVEQALAPELAKPTTAPSAWTTIGLLRLAAKDGLGALDAARKGVALGPQSDEPIYLALNLPQAQERDAELLVQQFLERSPDSEVRLAYARKLIVSQRFVDAYVQLERLNTETPALADAWLLRGSIELQDRKLAAAQKSLTTYVTLTETAAEPSGASGAQRGRVQAYLMLAEIAEKNQQFDAANAYLQRIDSPQNATQVSLRRAMILARQGKIEQARMLVRSLPESDPADARNKLSMEVQLLRDSKQFSAAYQLLRTAVERDPQDVEWAYELATVAEKLGKFDEMEQLLRAAIAKKPDYHPAYNALGYSLADRNMRLPEARQLIEKALEFAPEDPFIIDSLAWVEYRSGNTTEALRLLQDAFRARPDAEIAAHLGEVLWSLGDKNQATQIWSEGKALNAENETLLETIRRLSPKP